MAFLQLRRAVRLRRRSRGHAPEPSRIAERAYELYVHRDRQDGGAVEDWLKAEQQLLASSQSQVTAPGETNVRNPAKGVIP